MIFTFWDSHIHSDVSFDGSYSYSDFVTRARKLSLCGLTFTEHFDIYNNTDPHDEKARPFNKEEYLEKFTKAKNEFGDFIRMGVEIGLRPDSENIVKEVAGFFDYDFIIGSSHIVDLKNISHDHSFYDGLSKEESYDKYLLELYENVKLSADNFDVYGHLDYVARYGRYDNPHMECTDTLDMVLKLLIEKGKGIEINTASFRLKSNQPHPNYSILKRYLELGGEIITLGSDAHLPDHLEYKFNEVSKKLNEIGFKYYCVFEKRKPNFMKLI